MNTCGKMVIELSNGTKMPMIALGTFRIYGNENVYKILDYALQAGYRSFDTAAVYGNENSIGQAFTKLLPKYKLNREDIFLITKLSPRDHGNESRINAAVQNSLSCLRTNYIDLYLIHWPGVEGSRADNRENPKIRSDTWHSLVKLHKDGVLKSIGVSNYNIKHLKELLSNDGGVKPMVNQVEWHPHYHQEDLRAFCKHEKIVLQAYSPLGSSNTKQLLRDPTVNALAQDLKCSVAQLLIRWSIQQGIPVAAKASSKEHIENNLLVNFTIPNNAMMALSNLKISEKYAWNPDVVY